MSTQLQLRRGTAAALASFAGALGELAVDTTNKRVTLHDGATAGGIALARLDDVAKLVGAFGSLIKLVCIEGATETIATGATTYTSAVIIPARTMVFGIGSRVGAAITGCTAWEIGVAGTPAMFATGLGVAAGSQNAGLGGPNSFYSNTALLMTSTAGGNFTGGTVRLAVLGLQIGAPTS